MILEINMKIFVAQINPIVAHLEYNTNKILTAIEEAKLSECNCIITPELALTGYPPKDFVYHDNFVEQVEKHILTIQDATSNITLFLGSIRKHPSLKPKQLLNSCIVISDKKILGYQDKSLLPTYDVFDERRYFTSAKEMNVFEIQGKKVGVTICEDIWKHADETITVAYKRDPVEELALLKPDVMFNLSASPFNLKKPLKRIQICSKAAKTLNCPIILCNQVGGNDSLIFDGHSLVIDNQGRCLHQAKGFQEDCYSLDLHKLPSPLNQVENNDMENLFQALVLGIQDYFQKQHFDKALIGLSGGIDSAVVAVLAVHALGHKQVEGILMPSRFSSKSSIEDSKTLAANLGIHTQTISIEKPFTTFLEVLEPHFQQKPFDVTEENLQSRIRGLILMALSNKHGYIVLSTGNKSEFAMGYSTLYGDLCGGLAVISDVLKTQIYDLARWINRHQEIIPQNILDKPPSAELKENQKDLDTLPDYGLLDTVITAYVEEFQSPETIASTYGFDLELVRSLIQKIHKAEYKRRQSPPGLRVTSKAFTVGRIFPIVQGFV